MPQTIKLADALLRRKELQEKVDILRKIKDNTFFETRVRRVNVTDSTDEVTAQICRLTAAQVTAEFDWHARQLRLIDSAIQRANWTTDIEITDSVMGDYQPPSQDKEG